MIVLKQAMVCMLILISAPLVAPAETGEWAPKAEQIDQEGLPPLSPEQLERGMSQKVLR